MSRIQTEVHGHLAGLTRRKRFMCPEGFLSGRNGSQVNYHSPSTVAIFEDFDGDTIPASFEALEGSDSVTSDLAILAGGIGGVVRFTTGDVTGVTAANVLSNVEQLTGGALNWQASNDALAFECRIKLSSILTSYAFLGFTDLVGTAELPVVSAASADTITTNASDAVGFLFDVRMSTDRWFLVGVAGDTDATLQITANAPVANEYATFRIEVAKPVGSATVSSANFFYNGAQVGTTMVSAVTSATDLAWTIAVSKAAADVTSITAELDYVHVSMNRGANGTST